MTGALQSYEMSKRQELLKQYNIKQNKNGYYYAHYYMMDGGKKSKQKTITRKNLKEIENFLLDLIIKTNDNPSIDDLFPDVIKFKIIHDKIKESTVIRYKKLYKQFFKDFGTKRIKNITEKNIEDFLIQTVSNYQNLTSKEYSNLVSLVRAIFNYARYKNYLDIDYKKAIENAYTMNRRLKNNKKENHEEVFSDEEETTLMQWLWKSITTESFHYHKNRAIMHDMGLLLLFYTGLRRGELAALKWQDYQSGFLFIHATEQQVECNNTITTAISDTPKTEAGNRMIPIPDVALKIFDLAKQYNPNNEFIFTFRNNRIKSEAFRDRLERVCKLAGVPYKHPHVIRKTFATHCIESGMTYHDLIGIMGHVSEEITKRYYERQRTTGEKKRIAINKVFAS
jgi:integrase